MSQNDYDRGYRDGHVDAQKTIDTLQRSLTKALEEIVSLKSGASVPSGDSALANPVEHFKKSPTA